MEFRNISQACQGLKIPNGRLPGAGSPVPYDPKSHSPGFFTLQLSNLLHAVAASPPMQYRHKIIQTHILHIRDCSRTCCRINCASELSIPPHLLSGRPINFTLKYHDATPPPFLPSCILRHQSQRTLLSIHAPTCSSSGCR